MTLRSNSNRFDFVALLGAFALFLSTVEYMIPKPLPFMRIGLANLPLLIGLGLLTAPEYFLLALLKVVGQGLVSGTLFSYIALFSLAGTAASATLMYLLHRYLRKWLSLLGISIAGAMASNIAQLYLSQILLFGEAVRLVAPPFLIVGFITSILLGVFANKFVATSQWYRSVA